MRFRVLQALFSVRNNGNDFKVLRKKVESKKCYPVKMSFKNRGKKKNPTSGIGGQTIQTNSLLVNNKKN